MVRRPGVVECMSNHTQHAAETDVPAAGLMTDLKSRGLLDTTLVIMHSEFGRMPISQRGVGRDHNPGAQTVLMVGAGIKGGQAIGATDEFGYKAQEQLTDVSRTLLLEPGCMIRQPFAPDGRFERGRTRAFWIDRLRDVEWCGVSKEWP